MYNMPKNICGKKKVLLNFFDFSVMPLSLEFGCVDVFMPIQEFVNVMSGQVGKGNDNLSLGHMNHFLQVYKICEHMGT